MPFALDGNPSPSEIADAINYIIANLNFGTPANAYPVSNNPTTGFISNTLGDVLQYQYRYLDIKYADSPTGTNFTDNPASRLYFGVYNSDTVSESTNPTDYTWIQVTGGFGAAKVLWILTQGGRHASFYVGASTPDNNANWRVAPIRSVDLDNPFQQYDQYMSIKFATNAVGSGMSDTKTNATYYGVATTADGSTSTDPTVYEWSPFAFGTTYSLYYRSYGGRNIAFAPSVNQPLGYIPFAVNTINLDVATLGSADGIGVVSQTVDGTGFFQLTIEGAYQYLLIKFGSSIAGAGISSDPTGLSYYGIQASDVLTLDNNPADYTWFYAGGTFKTVVNLWSRSNGNNTCNLSLTLNAPDTSGWQNITLATDVLDPFIDLYARTGTVVTNLSSPTSGRIGYSIPGVDGTVNINLNPYGAGASTGGFSIAPASVATINFDEFGRVINSVALDQVRFSSMLTHATSGQTAFTFSNAQTNQIMVFQNGCFLKAGTDYTRNSTTVTFTNACTLNDVIAIYYIRLIDATTSADKVPFVTTSVTLTSGQTSVSSSYIDGSEMLFMNGALLVDADYSYIGTNSGYTLSQPALGGTLVIISFAFNNGNVLIFQENFTQTTYLSTNVTFPTQFYRNSSLIWFNGALLRPSTDYTISGSGSLSYSITLVGSLTYAGQPVQFMSFNSSGEASASSVSAAGVLGMDMPVVIEHQPTMLDMFNALKKEVTKLKKEVKLLKEMK